MIKILTINLLESLRSDKLEICKVHLQNGADPNYVIPSEGVAPIHLAAGLGVSATSLLVEYGGNPNVQSSEGSTPLHVAATWGDEACVKLLLQSGADPHLKDQDGFRPLDVAKVYGHEEVFLYLKYYSLLLLSQDDDVSEKFTRYSLENGPTNIFGRGELKCYENCEDDDDDPSDLLDSLICCPNPDVLFTQTINQKLCNQLKHGNKVVLDVTSPDNPYIDYKRSFKDDYRRKSIEPVSPNSRRVHAASFKPSHNNDNKESNNQSNDGEPSYFSPSCQLQTNQRHGKYSSPSLVDKKANPNFVSTSYQLQDHDLTTKRSPLPEFQHNFKHNNTLQWVANHARLSLPQRKDRSNPEDLDRTPTNVKAAHRSRNAQCLSSPMELRNSPLHYRNLAKQSKKCTSSALNVRNFNPNISSTSHSDSDTTLSTTSSMDPACKHYSRREFVQTKSNIVPRRCRDDRNKLHHQFENGNWLRNGSNCANDTHSFSAEMSDTSCISDDTISNSYGDTYANMISECVPLCDDSGHVINVSDIERQNRHAYEQWVTDNKEHWFLTDQAGDGTKHHNSHGCNQGHNILGCNYCHASSKLSCVHQEMNSNHKPGNNILCHPYFSSSELPSSKQSLPTTYTTDPNSSPESTDSITSASTIESVQFDMNAAHLSNICPDESRSTGSPYQTQDITLTTSPEIMTQHKPYNKSDKRRESDSSSDTFMTCEEIVSPDGTEKSAQTQAAVPPSTKSGHTLLPRKQSHHHSQISNEKHTDDDMYTSDDSFVDRINAVTVSKKKSGYTSDDSFVTVRKKKSGCEGFQHLGELTDRLKSFKLDKIATLQQPSGTEIKTSQIQEPKRLSSSVLDTAFRGGHRPSIDSMYSNISVKEYIYRDDERGITLIERHVPSECGNSTGRLSLDSVTSAKSVDSQKTEEYDWKTYVKKEDMSEKDTQDVVEEVATQQFSQLSNEDLRNQLRMHGDDPGPILATTRQAYLVRLASISQNPRLGLVRENRPDYSQELRNALEGKFDMDGLEDFECKLIDLFNNSNGRKWREGKLKSSFNYLLLDPRVTKNLPLRSKNMGELDVFCTFIAAIFYVGKGKRSRPYAHLYEAITQMQKPKPNKSSKVQQIIDIWSEGYGVVSLHIFQNVIPVEAYTREACIIQSIGLDKLTNKKKGDFYGVASAWSLKVKRRMGVYFLKKALQIFLAEGERQISPPDIKSN